MRLVLLIATLFMITACGKDNLSPSKSQNINGLASKTAILKIPHPNVFGGGPTLDMGVKVILIGTQSQQVSNLINGLRDGQLNVLPIQQDNLTKSYNVQYIGTETTGPCPFNPMAQCNVINLDYLQTY